MAIFYFNGAVNDNWTELGNWWTDDSFTTQADNLPSNSDSVIIYSDLSSNSGGDPTIVNLTVESGVIGINITVSNIATFNNYSANYAIITGNAIFNDYSVLIGQIYGDATFNDLAHAQQAAYVSGDAIFTADTQYLYFNPIVISGTVIFASTTSITFIVQYFNVSDVNLWTVNSSQKYWIFINAYLSESTSISANLVTFYGNSANDAGVIDSDVILNDISYNNGIINGNVVFNDRSYNHQVAGIINGNAIFNDYSSNRAGLSGTVVVNNRISPNGSSLLGIL